MGTAQTAVRTFRINVPEDDLVDLRRRFVATRWPEKETVADEIAVCAAGDESETRALLGDRMRLA